MFWETKSYLALRILLCQILPLGQLFLPVVICESIVPSQNITIHVRFFLLSWPLLIALLQSRCHFSKYHCYVKPDWYELRWAEKSYQNLTVWKRRMYFCLKQWEGIITCAEDRKDLSSHCRRAGLQRADPPSSCAPLLLRPEASTTQHEGFLRSHHSRNVTAKQRHAKTISRQSNYTAGIKVSELVSAEGCAASVWEGSSESLAGCTLCAPLPYPQYHVALSWPGQGLAPVILTQRGKWCGEVADVSRLWSCWRAGWKQTKLQWSLNTQSFFHVQGTLLVKGPERSCV